VAAAPVLARPGSAQQSEHLDGIEAAAPGQRVDRDHGLDQVEAAGQVVGGAQRGGGGHSAAGLRLIVLQLVAVHEQAGRERPPPGMVSSAGASTGPHEAPSSSAAE
jgi:hypothetical protein